MKNTSASAVIAAPYAEALMSAAQASNLTEQIGEDARSIASVLANSPELRDFLGSPIIDAAKKKAVLGQVFGNSLQPYTANILRLLVDRRRILFLEEICQQYQALLRQLKQTVLAEVVSAVELSEAQRQAVIDKVKALTGAQQVELEAKIDREIIGGVTIKVGSQIIDASLRGQLRRIGLRLSA